MIAAVCAEPVRSRIAPPWADEDCGYVIEFPLCEDPEAIAEAQGWAADREFDAGEFSGVFMMPELCSARVGRCGGAS